MLWIFVFCKNMVDIGKIESKNKSGNYSQKLLDHVKESAADALKTASQKAIREILEATGDLIRYMIAEKTKILSRNSFEHETENSRFLLKILNE